MASSLANIQPTPPTPPVVAVDRMLVYLRQLITDHELSRRQVESRLGFTPGYLDQLLAGDIDLKLWQLIAVLEVLGKSPARFFAVLFPPTLPGDPRRHQPPKLRVDREVLEIYRIGLESVESLRQRLECCERRLGQLRPGAGRTQISCSASDVGPRGRGIRPAPRVPDEACRHR